MIWCDACQRERGDAHRCVKEPDNPPERRSAWRLFLDRLGLRTHGPQEAHHPIRGNPK